MSNQPFVDSVNDEIVDIDPTKAGLIMAALVRRLACNEQIVDRDALMMAADLIQVAVDPELETRRKSMHVAVRHNRLRLSVVSTSAAVN